MVGAARGRTGALCSEPNRRPVGGEREREREANTHADTKQQTTHERPAGSSRDPFLYGTAGLLFPLCSPPPSGCGGIGTVLDKRISSTQMGFAREERKKTKDGHGRRKS
jgi:hypothetical protein